MTNERLKNIKIRATHCNTTLHNVTITNRQRRLTNFYSTVSTHTEYTGYRYYRNRGSNDHQVREGHDQSINYFAKTCVKLLNNCFNRLSLNDKVDSKPFAFFTEHNTLIFQKIDKKYYINGNKCTKARLNAVIPGILMRINVERNGEAFNKFVDMIIDTDPVISSAIVNKIEYTFYDNDKMIETLLNVEKTGKEYSAIELYEGLWVNFKDTQMKSFINSCKGNKNKFLGVSPEELYYLSTKKFLSDSEVKVVYAFLEQNRKSSLVEQRSMELFKDLTERFKGKIFERSMFLESKENGPSKCMGVKGKQLDWIVVDRGYKAGRQDVSTYAVISCNNYNQIEDLFTPKDTDTGLTDMRTNSLWVNECGKERYLLLGPICIDQAHTGISIGDQFASRSMALLNDVHSFNQVSTLRNYVRYKPTERVEWDALSVLQQSE